MKNASGIKKFSTENRKNPHPQHFFRECSSQKNLQKNLHIQIPQGKSPEEALTVFFKHLPPKKASGERPPFRKFQFGKIFGQEAFLDGCLLMPSKEAVVFLRRQMIPYNLHLRKPSCKKCSTYGKLLFGKKFSLCEEFLPGSFLGSILACAIARILPLSCEERCFFVQFLLGWLWLGPVDFKPAWWTTVKPKTM